MSAEDFAKWLEAKLTGRGELANAVWSTVASEALADGIRPAVVVGFASGDAFVLTVATVAR